METDIELPLLDNHRSGINVVYRIRHAEYGYVKDCTENDAMREVAAYIVSEHMGLGVVPFTTMIDNPTFGRIVFSQEVEDGPCDTTYDSRRLHLEYFLSDIKKIALFDCIITNTDRHSYNYRTTSDGSPIGIDHGYSMHNPDAKGRCFRSVFYQCAARHDFTMTDELRQACQIDCDALETALLAVGLDHEAIDPIVKNLIHYQTAETLALP